MAEIPQISVAFDLERSQWQLFVTYMKATDPAGPRLFRADPPNVAFIHATKDAADADAQKLQQYLDRVWTSRK